LENLSATSFTLLSWLPIMNLIIKTLKLFSLLWGYLEVLLSTLTKYYPLSGSAKHMSIFIKPFWAVVRAFHSFHMKLIFKTQILWVAGAKENSNVNRFVAWLSVAWRKRGTVFLEFSPPPAMSTKHLGTVSDSGKIHRVSEPLANNTVIQTLATFSYRVRTVYTITLNS